MVLHIGKYTQSLMFIKKFSQSNLKYERKININFNPKKSFIFKLSDIHFEIDMELLGCNAKVLLMIFTIIYWIFLILQKPMMYLFYVKISIVYIMNY